MPHCIVEYSQGLADVIEPAQLNMAVFEGALASGLFGENDIKTRSIAYADYQTGAVKSEFIHVVIKLLQGRSMAQRASLSQRVLDSLGELELSSVSLTVQVCEIENDSYAKRVV